ncbi:MAG: J domain-containing protein, partial [Nitrosotalea sp.]
MNSDKCYNLLGLKRGASVPEIRNAYRKLALECHPDKNTSAKDGVKFKLITEAYQTLRVKTTSTDRAFDIMYQNQPSSIYRGITSWNFYLGVFCDVLNYAKKIRYVKTVYPYVSKSKSILLGCYGLTRQHIVMSLFNLMRFSYRRIGPLISRMPYR